MASLIRQSFDVFNVYGKSEDAVENIILGFNLALEDQHMDDIARAFREWLKTSPTMPTPADIRKLAVEYEGYRASRERVYDTPRPAQRAKGGLDPWCYKPYKQAIEDGAVHAYFDHYKGQHEEVREYAYEWLRYAVKFLEYPHDILATFRNTMSLPSEPKVMASIARRT